MLGAASDCAGATAVNADAAIAVAVTILIAFFFVHNKKILLSTSNNSHSLKNKIYKKLQNSQKH